MKQAFFAIFVVFFSASTMSGAQAAATEWVEEAGARIRLLVAEPEAGDTEIKAALQVELKDGWKTYWRDPGDAGVPPQISVTGEGITGFEVLYPAPDRFDDGKSIWAGYKHMVAFPLTLKISGDKPVFPIKASSFLGICEDICIPVQNEFGLDVRQAQGSTADQALVKSFFDVLPASAVADFKISGLKKSAGQVEIDLTAPESAAPFEVFLAADGYMFGVPELVSQTSNSLRYAAKVIFEPKNATDADVYYTVKSAGRAVSGTVLLAAEQ
jgi:DsbC/DsbD-like thiol-disulfide interchange protein